MDLIVLKTEAIRDRPVSRDVAKAPSTALLAGQNERHDQDQNSSPADRRFRVRSLLLCNFPEGKLPFASGIH